MEHHAIKRQEDGYVGWLSHSPEESWKLFFRDFPCPTSRYEGRRAYGAIGYKCVRVEVKEL